MGREVRRVPPNWSHPVVMRGYGREGKQPMYDESYERVRAEWLDGLRKWEAGEDDAREKYKNDDGTYRDWWEWHGTPPERAYYRPWTEKQATWFQLWETVSEGTPVSPPFATREELADYLAENGDEWDQKRCLDPKTCELFGYEYGKSGWGKKAADAFVKVGWAPSMMVVGPTVVESKDIPAFGVSNPPPQA